MKVIQGEQGSIEWIQRRLGIPTGSGFGRIVNSDGKKSASFMPYMWELGAETVTGAPLDRFSSDDMDRGTELEPEARAWFEFQSDQDVEQVAFVTLDNGEAGVSPDGLLPGSGIEIKCPKADTQLRYLIGNKLPTIYVPQVQGCMWVCERDSWDFLSYHPLMPKLLITVPRDDKFIAWLARYVSELNERKQKTLEKYWGTL